MERAGKTGREEDAQRTGSARRGIGGGVGAAGTRGNASAKDSTANRALEERAREQANIKGDPKKKAEAQVKMQTSAMPGGFLPRAQATMTAMRA